MRRVSRRKQDGELEAPRKRPRQEGADGFEKKDAADASILKPEPAVGFSRGAPLSGSGSVASARRRRSPRLVESEDDVGQQPVTNLVSEDTSESSSGQRTTDRRRSEKRRTRSSSGTKKGEQPVCKKKRTIEVWCWCRREDDGEIMVECAAEQCEHRWFHARCVRLQSHESDWTCADCERRTSSERAKVAECLTSRLVDRIVSDEEDADVGRSLADVVYAVHKQPAAPYRAPDRDAMIATRLPVRACLKGLVDDVARRIEGPLCGGQKFPTKTQATGGSSSAGFASDDQAFSPRETDDDDDDEDESELCVDDVRLYKGVRFHNDDDDYDDDDDDDDAGLGPVRLGPITTRGTSAAVRAGENASRSLYPLPPRSRRPNSTTARLVSRHGTAKPPVLVSPAGRPLYRCPEFFSESFASWRRDRELAADVDAADAAVRDAKAAARRRKPRRRQLDPALAVHPELPAEPPSLEAAGSRLSDLLEFVCARERLRVTKAEGGPWPWSDVPILNTYRFTNVHREDDRVTSWLRANWTARYDRADPAVVLLNCAVFRVFGTVAFAEAMGWTPTLEAFDPERAVNAAVQVWNSGLHAFTRAYCRPRFNSEVVKATASVQSASKRSALRRQAAPSLSAGDASSSRASSSTTLSGLQPGSPRPASPVVSVAPTNGAATERDPALPHHKAPDQARPPVDVYRQAAAKVSTLVAVLPDLLPAGTTVTWHGLATALRKVKGFGGTGFVAKELILDATGFSSVRAVVVDPGDWTLAGPGARRGLNRLFNRNRNYGVLAAQDTPVEQRFIDEIALITRATSRPRPGVANATATGSAPVRIPEDLPDLTIHDVQFVLCEFDKYCRAQDSGASLARYMPLEGTRFDTSDGRPPSSVAVRRRDFEVHLPLSSSLLVASVDPPVSADDPNAKPDQTL